MKGRKRYNSLQTCTRKLARVIDSLHLHFEFRINERSRWVSRKRNENLLPDAYFVVPSSKGRIDWMSIAVPGVYYESYDNEDIFIQVCI